MKEKLHQWFTEQPRREKRRVLEVRVEDEAGRLYDQFSLEEERLIRQGMFPRARLGA